MSYKKNFILTKISRKVYYFTKKQNNMHKLKSEKAIYSC